MVLKYLELIRYKNLLIIAFSQCVFHFGFLNKQQGISLALNPYEFIILVFATVCIAAGGYIINNIMDQQTDTVAKPNKVVVGKYISENNAYNTYIGFTITGVVLGFIVSNLIDKTSFVGIFMVTSFLLYLYATQFKQSLLAGNFLVAFLTSFCILLVGIFDLYPVITTENRAVLGLFFRLIIDFAIFAFLINFIREIIKDLEDYEGDLKSGMNTLPIFLGIEKTKKITFILCFIPLISIIYYAKTHLIALEYALYYVFVCVIAPFLYVMIKIWQSENQKDFNHLSKLLKWIMVTGVIAILVINYNVGIHEQ